jgi:hypothetical protein
MVVRNGVVPAGMLWQKRVLGCTDVNADRCGGAERKNAGPPNRRLKDKLRMKKHDHSGSNQGGGKDGRSRRTEAQRRTQREMTQCSQGWNDQLAEDQRTAWRRLAETLPRRSRKGRSYRVRGHQVFRAINSVLMLLGRPPRTDPPPLPKFGVNPRIALQIKGTSRGLALKLRLSGTPTEDIMVFASPPWKAGRTYCGDYRFIGLLPAPVKGWSDITRLYVKKFGVPPPNTRVFIRTWQVVDGWEDRGQMQLTNALVPTR